MVNMQLRWNKRFKSLNYLKSKNQPHTALALYIKLYCKRKGSSKTKCLSNLVEATKSWLTLSEKEKKQFYDKHKEYDQKFYLQHFKQLKNAEPFMKVKYKRLDNITLNTNQNNEINQEPQRSPCTETELMVNEEMSIEPEEVPNIELQQNQDQENVFFMEILENPNQSLRTYVVEPLPPTLKTGKDLFHILKSTDEENYISWTSLPRLEKNRFSRAVFLLKNDYLTKYKEYLERMTHEELFNHYNKTFL